MTSPERVPEPVSNPATRPDEAATAIVRVRWVAGFLLHEYDFMNQAALASPPTAPVALQAVAERGRDAIYEAAALLFKAAHQLEDAEGKPLPMLIHCPLCSARHIDRGEFATKPHHTHACQDCGHVWRPAIEPTVGVLFLPGFKDLDG